MDPAPRKDALFLSDKLRYLLYILYFLGSMVMAIVQARGMSV